MNNRIYLEKKSVRSSIRNAIFFPDKIIFYCDQKNLCEKKLNKYEYKVHQDHRQYLSFLKINNKTKKTKLTLPVNGLFIITLSNISKKT